ncbi:hypothetical protein GCM10007084_06550 [Parabacteroides faecis]|jgi:lipoprotein|nr:hypothetical protein DWX23_21870 [Parabacteroides sp. AF18-52]GGJ85585.1 hypothetical protein GCM10007084_06550 [Parabacteroides faecis]
MEMKGLFQKYRLNLLTGCLLLVFGICGCEQEVLIDQKTETTDHTDAICIVTRVSSDIGAGEAKASDKENAIRSLRLFVFSSDGKTMLLNKYFLTSDAAGEIPSNTFTYFVKTADDEFKISELLKKQNIIICLVANELKSMDGTLTYEQVRDARLDFSSIYDSNGMLDISLAGQGNASNKGYIPMYAETKSLSTDEWNAGQGKIINMSLIRSVAKVVLQITKGTLSGNDWDNNVEVTFKEASVVRIPQYGFMGLGALPYEGSQISTTTSPFDSYVVSKSSSLPSSKQLVFYVPEFIMSQSNNQQYSYLQITADYHTDTEDLKTTYKIPLGNGVQQLYNNSGKQINDLSQSELSLTRNTQYNVNATVSSIGTLAIFQIELNVTGWTKTEEISGSVNTPVLNVTSKDIPMSVETVRVFFWTNQEEVFIEEEGIAYDGSKFNVNNLFDNLAGQGVSNFHLFKSQESSYYPYNGYMDIKFVSSDTYNNNNKYTLILNAGGLKRTVVIESNPVVAQIIFNANGGSGSTNPCEVRYSQLEGMAILGKEITVHSVDIPVFISPSGMVFSGKWTYTSSGAEVPDDGNGNLTVTLHGSTTYLSALWIDK